MPYYSTGSRGTRYIDHRRGAGGAAAAARRDISDALNAAARATSRARSSAPSSFAPTSRGSIFYPETKYFDCAIADSVTVSSNDWAGSEVQCSTYINTSGANAAYTDSALIPSAIGSGYGQVIGNRYKLKKIRVRGKVQLPTYSDQPDALGNFDVRLMLVMDTQPNGAQAQGEDIMQDMGGSEQNMWSFKRVATSSGRFRILKDKMWTVPVTNSQTDGTNLGSIAYSAPKFSFQYTPREPIVVNIKVGNATPSVAGLETCNIFMLCIASSPAGNPGVAYVVANSRCYYCE
jgi:hypothetical protein